MLPIRKLLSRIRWDKEFGQGSFEIGYYDRMAGEVIRVSFRDLVIGPEERDAFLVQDEDGVYQRIPLHRVREVYKNGECIWQRPAR